MNLEAAFPDNAETAMLDIIFIAGDLFDDLLSFPDDDVWEIKIWVGRFLRRCKKHDIMVRVLEGTPGHDWKQSEIFPSTNVIADIGADLKYVKDLSIEYIERFGITVLYVPDEWENTTEKTLSQVHDLLTAKGLDKVDYAIMHGQFDYQLPPFIKAQKHDAQAYLSIVRHLIFIGHVHVHSRFDRIIAQGSFDRLTHGEEGPKGHVRAVIRNNGDYDVTFVENVGAKRFVTVHCVDMSLDRTLEEVDAVAGDLPAGSFVRIEANHDSPLFTSMETLVRRYPLYTWSTLPRNKEEELGDIVEDETVYAPITLTKENLGSLLLERLAHAGATAVILDASKQLLEEVM